MNGVRESLYVHIASMDDIHVHTLFFMFIDDRQFHVSICIQVLSIKDLYIYNKTRASVRCVALFLCHTTLSIRVSNE